MDQPESPQLFPYGIDVEAGSHVLTAECRPISKSVSYVVVEVKE